MIGSVTSLIKNEILFPPVPISDARWHGASLDRLERESLNAGGNQEKEWLKNEY
jgi:hypothetical protein